MARRIAILMCVVWMLILGAAVAVRAQLPTQSTGDNITATIWNNLINVVNTLYGGTAKQVYTSNGAGLVGSFQDFPLPRFATTLTNDINTTAPTNVVTWTVPANTWSDGDAFFVTITSLDKNNSGGVAHNQAAFKAGAGTLVSWGNETWNDDANEYKSIRSYLFTRVGSDVWGTQGVGMAQLGGLTSVNNIRASTPTNFTTDILMAVVCDFDVNNVLTYMKPQNARVVQIRN